MNLTVGDVFFLILAIVGGLTAAWAGSVLTAMLFPQKTEQASHDFEDRAWSMFLLGLVTFAPLFIMGIAMMQNPVLRIVAIPLLLAILSVSMIGSGGLVRLVARRIDDHGGAQSNYQAIAKGAALVFIAEFLPFFGWFFIFPFVLIASFGAGIKTVLVKKRAAVEAPPTAEA